MKKILIPAFASLAIACGPAPPIEGDFGSAGSPIVYGEPDTSHQAVVAYYASGSLCSATIITRVGNEGYALTAAHCIGPQLGTIRQGDNHAIADVTYSVVEAAAHPKYPQFPLFDFGMLRFSGATDATPGIPALAPANDALAVGSPVELVGYGNTEGGSTTVRHHVETTLDEIGVMRLLVIQPDGGMCSGDDGGPMLADVAATEHVAGVMSFLDSSCTEGRGAAVRVSMVYDSFITPFIDKTPYLPESCAACYEAALYGGPCVDEMTACLDDTGCTDLMACVDACGDDTCRAQCFSIHPDGSALYLAAGTCACVTQCPQECTSDADSDGMPDHCDICDSDPEKIQPGICGCGTSDAVDTDGDGVPDGCDTCAGSDDNADADGDSVPDGCDLCSSGDDAADADTDGVPDACDACPGSDDTADADGDGIPDDCDEETCDDQQDNDGDGTTDCDDAACTGDAACETPAEGCSCGSSNTVQTSLSLVLAIAIASRRRRRSSAK